MKVKVKMVRKISAPVEVGQAKETGNVNVAVNIDFKGMCRNASDNIGESPVTIDFKSMCKRKSAPVVAEQINKDVKYINEINTENAVEFIWYAKISTEFYKDNSLKTIYNWLYTMAKSDYEAKGQRIVGDKITASLDFPLNGDEILITVTQKVYVD